MPALYKNQPCINAGSKGTNPYEINFRYGAYTLCMHAGSICFCHLPCIQAGKITQQEAEAYKEKLLLSQGIPSNSRTKSISQGQYLFNFHVIKWTKTRNVERLILQVLQTIVSFFVWMLVTEVAEPVKLWGAYQLFRTYAWHKMCRNSRWRWCFSQSMSFK